MVREAIEEVDGGLERVLSRPSVQHGLVSILVEALASHALVWLAAGAGAAAWGWTVMHPTWIGIAATVGYCGTVLLPVILRDMRSSG